MTQIHPSAIIDPKAQLGVDVQIGPFCTVGPNVVLGDGVKLTSHVVVDGHTTIGARTLVHPLAFLGGPPQHLAHKGEPTELIIGERNVIRENVTMHTGTVGGGGVTRVGSDSLYMVGAHVAHDCIVGNNVTFANNATLGGHVQVGDFVFMGGLSAVHQFTRIGRYAFVGGGGVVTKDIIPYGSVWGNHAHLEGLNLVGLKRRGFSREAIIEVYQGSAEVMEIVNFIRSDANRPICLPHD
jgi:UDP-N-acetylglucosamine acyltransferase